MTLENFHQPIWAKANTIEYECEVNEFKLDLRKRISMPICLNGSVCVIMLNLS